MEDRTYKGYEILKMLDEGKIEDGTELIFRSTFVDEEIIVKVNAVTKSLINTDTKEILSSGWLFNSTIQFKEKNIDIIDIQKIQGFDTFHPINSVFSTPEDVRAFISEEMIPKINEIISALKQLDNKGEK